MSSLLLSCCYFIAKKHKKIPEYITATQYKSLKEDLKYFARLSKKEPFNIKVFFTNFLLFSTMKIKNDIIVFIHFLSK